MPTAPNVLLIVTDQHRGDCIGRDPAAATDSDGQSIIHTPHLDALTAEGALFSRGYTPVPSCAPARRCLRTGQTPVSSNSTNWITADWNFEAELSQIFQTAGYETMGIGRFHHYPRDESMGFERTAYHPGHDYDTWLSDRVPDTQITDTSHGIGPNGWDARPFHLDESLHPTVWTTNRALEGLDSREADRPFFLHLSYLKPHTPFDPPRAYWDLYEDRDLPAPAIGDWVDDHHGGAIPSIPRPDAWRAELPDGIIERARQGYYGLITQIDHQLNRVFHRLRSAGEWENTIVIMTSDHGDMLGDHHLWRKCYGYEASSRVPFIVKPPRDMDIDRGRIVSQPVGLEDVMPTLLETCDIPIPDTVDGRSVLPLLRSGDTDWRDYYHGEHGPIYEPENATQYLISEQFKYLWNPVTDDELLFDLEADPLECRDLSDSPSHAALITTVRDRLIDRLTGRQEGFVDNGQLTSTDLPFAAGHYSGFRAAD